MKRIGAIALALILSVTLWGCGRRKEEVPATEPTINKAPTVTEPTIIPDVPPIETNIPDPTVNSNSTEPMTEETTTGTTLPRKRPAPRSHHWGN